MLLSTQTSHLHTHFGLERAIGILAEAGFEAFDLSLFGMFNDGDEFVREGWRDRAYAIREFADKVGIPCNQAHAPFPSTKQDDAFNEMAYQRIVQSMEVASIIGAKDICVHPCQHLYYVENVKELKEYNYRFYSSLTPYCEKFGIRVALENMFQGDPRRSGTIIESTCARPEEFCEYLDALDPKWFTALLDIGHCGLAGQNAARCIRVLGHDRLGALHIHDNDYKKDQHTLPFTRSLDWAAIAQALADIDYKGDLTLEADCFLAGFPVEFKPEASRFMCRADGLLRDMIEKAKR